MWSFLIDLGRILTFDINNKENVALVTTVREMFMGMRSCDSTYEFTNNFVQKYNCPLTVSKILRAVPNEETSFVVQTVNVLNTALKSGNFDVAYDIADVLKSLPDTEILKNKNAVRDFNKTHITVLNQKWENLLVPKLLVIS